MSSTVGRPGRATRWPKAAPEAPRPSLDIDITSESR